MRKLLFIIFYGFVCFGTIKLLSQVKKTEVTLKRVLFVFDASKSMKTKHGAKTRIQGAKELFYDFIDSLNKQKNIQFALRMYGSTVAYPPGDCKDSKLIVPFGPNNIGLIKNKVAEANPTGITPIEHSLTEAANDFPDTKSINMIILITDGIEECDGDPCKARQKLMEKGIVFKPFIIGIGLTLEQIKTFECVGDYYDFDNTQTLSNINSIISNQKKNKTTVQVNLLDTKSLPTETNVSMTFYDSNKHSYIYNYLHTLNVVNHPDTLCIDEYPCYKVVAHTIPPTESKNANLTQGKHNIIAIDAPQGYIELRRPVGIYNFNEKVKCIVRKTISDMKTLHVQQMNTIEKYITGSYDLEILTLPRTYISSVKVVQSQTKLLEIPNAGMLVVRALDNGDGCILKDNKKLDWVCNLNNTTSQVYYLQPGNYRIEWRAKSLKGSIYTVEKRFTITSDLETKVELYK